MPRGKDLPIYWRNGRAWLHGGRWGQGRIPLRPEGQALATTDATVARRLARGLVSTWEAQQLNAARLGLLPGNDLAAAGDDYMAALRAEGKSETYIRYVFHCLNRACVFFDEVQAAAAKTAAERKRCKGPRNIGTISPPDVRAFVAWLRATPGGLRGNKTLSDATVRQHLAALSGVFALAISDGRLPMDQNPVAALTSKPKQAATNRTLMMEPHELALLLESARTMPAQGGKGGRAALACLLPLLTFYVYTGAREGEVSRAEVPDLHFAATRKYPTGWIRIRGTKTEGSVDRSVPMHPHHREILLDYLRTIGRAGGRLFTANDGGQLRDWRKSLDLVAGRVGYASGEVRTRRFRTSYASHRCTCDDADSNTVRLELGHSDLAMMSRVYAAAQRASERMGAEFSYRLDTWAHNVPPETLALLAA
jgi:integrase